MLRNLFYCCLITSIIFFLYAAEASELGQDRARGQKQMLSRINKGEVIDIVAPSSGFVPNQVMSTVESKLESLGFKVRIPKNMFRETLFCSNTDDYRFEHLERSIYNEDSKVIWAIRGGYGAARLLEKLQQRESPAHEKLLVGYSDITALHLFFSQKWGWRTIHGSVAKDMADPKLDPKNINLLISMISGKIDEVSIPIEKRLNEIDISDAKGRLTGGNLSVVQTSIGTHWQLDGKGKIIFLEEVGEQGYRVDRMLEHLYQAGVFDGARAVIFGEFVMNSAEEESGVMTALIRFSKKLNIPAFKTNYFGHGYHNYPIVYNANAQVACSKGACALKYSVR